MKYLTVNILTTQIFAAMAIIGTIVGFYAFGVTLATIGISILGYFLYVCLGVVVTFHRGLSHSSYKTHPIISKIGTFLGCMANTGSSIAWVAIHTRHHLYTDKKGDPHSPWVSGYKTLFLDYSRDEKIKWRMRRLITDPFHQVLHRYYYGFLVLWSLLLFAVGGWYLMIFLHWAPTVIGAVVSNIVNYAGHMETAWGSSRTYNTPEHSCNNWILAIPSWGDGWHNNHHRWPRRYTTSEHWWQVDISGLVIKLIKYKTR